MNGICLSYSANLAAGSDGLGERTLTDHRTCSGATQGLAHRLGPGLSVPVGVPNAPHAAVTGAARSSTQLLADQQACPITIGKTVAIATLRSHLYKYTV